VQLADDGAQVRPAHRLASLSDLVAPIVQFCVFSNLWDTRRAAGVASRGWSPTAKEGRA
jgi:hypothetical protein